jgi:Zn-dependent peptidase ImmA (M78 family)
MAIDLQQFGSKLTRYREQLKLSRDEVSAGTGIAPERVQLLENGAVTPSGDEVLILADYYKCDYRFFISNEQHAAFEQTENLYRRYGPEFSKQDRWSVQEFLFLCECEESLLSMLGRPKGQFSCELNGTYFKGHAEDCAAQLRRHLQYADNSVPSDVYSDFRKIGLHVFRRRLDNSNISGMTVHHPMAGACVLVNYSEDVYRQRFTAAHEAAHALFDDDEVIVSLSGREKELVEVRANTFASRYLLPPVLLKKIPVNAWDDVEIVRWAAKLKVSAIALGVALNESGVIESAALEQFRRVRVGREAKEDPELEGLSAGPLARKRDLLQRGLSNFYVSLCFDALADGAVSSARAAEMLMVGEDDLGELADLFRLKAVLRE